MDRDIPQGDALDLPMKVLDVLRGASWSPDGARVA
jgi:hypothetical protein